jgi:hypothetical protein
MLWDDHRSLIDDPDADCPHAKRLASSPKHGEIDQDRDRGKKEEVGGGAETAARGAHAFL